MELRKHPRMTWLNRPNWPPNWVGPYNPSRPFPMGEVGTLVGLEASKTQIEPHFVLIMSWNGAEYFGCLSFDDENFMKRMFDIFRRHISRPISEIARLDISQI
jgi:hypothetical protein